MKKRILKLIVSLLLTMNLSACGTQSAAGNGTAQNTPSDPSAGSSGQNIPGGIGTDSSAQNTPGGVGTDSSAQNTPGGIGTGTDSSILNISDIFDMEDSSFSFSSLAEFYNSQYRTLLEDATNEIISELTGLHAFITIEEPDTLIYNYQYLFSLSSIGLSHEEAAAITASNLQNADYPVLAVNAIREFCSYGVPLRALRMNYLDADGSLVYSVDYTEDGSSSGLPDSSGTTAAAYADLQEWITSSEEAALTVRSTNQALTSTGITFDLAADGNILVYKYYLPDAFFADSLAEEEQTAVFDSMLDASSSSVETVFAAFMDQYGLPVDAVRFVYYSKDGAELYSRDIMP